MEIIDTVMPLETDITSGFSEFSCMYEPQPDKPLRVLFVCTGNTCRSPMAAAALNALGCGRYSAESAGIFADIGAPISPYAALALEEAKISSTPGNNYKEHKARCVSDSVIAAADCVIGITESHMLLLVRGYPAYAPKVSAMKRDIADPFGGTKKDYRDCLADIIENLRLMFPLEPER